MNNTLRKYWYLLCVLPFMGFWTYGLTDLDEGFYGAVTMDMLRRGDWITPTLNGIPWFEKPILAYWLSMPFVTLMPNEFGARLPSFLCTLGTMWVLYRFVKKYFSVEMAIVTTLVFSTSLLVVAIGRMMMTDAPLVLCLTIAFTTFFESIQGQQKLRLVTATALGFAVLAKGPVALVLFGLIGIFAYWKLPESRKNWGQHWLTGTLIVLAIAATWYVPCYLANGQTFIEKFLIEQNIGRFRGGDTVHALKPSDPIGYLRIPAYFLFYPLTLALSSVAWIIGAFRGKWWQTTNTDQSKNEVLTFMMIWFMVVIVFFSISATKLVHYVLPCVPPLSLLISYALLYRHPKFSPDHASGLRRALRIATVASPAMLVLSQYAFYTDWSTRFKDVQSYAIDAREQNLRLYEVNIGRPDNSDDSVTLSLNDTGHPSLGFYYRKPIKADPGALESLPPGSMVVGRDLDLAASGKTETLDNGNKITITQRGRYTVVIVTD